MAFDSAADDEIELLRVNNENSGSVFCCSTNIDGDIDTAVAASEFRVELIDFGGSVITFDLLRLAAPQMMKLNCLKRIMKTVVQCFIVAPILTEISIQKCQPPIFGLN